MDLNDIQELPDDISERTNGIEASTSDITEAFDLHADQEIDRMEKEVNSILASLDNSTLTPMDEIIDELGIHISEGKALKSIFM